MAGPAQAVDGLEVLAENVENSDRKAVVLKPYAAYQAYRDMLHYYAVKNLLEFMRQEPAATLASMCQALAAPRQTQWVNLGGQLFQAADAEQIRRDIKDGKLDRWSDIHAAYDRMWDRYPRDKQRHALAVLMEQIAQPKLTPRLWQEALDRAVVIQKHVRDQTYASRKKDFDSPFRRMVYHSDAQMKAVLGSADDNSFVKQVRRETEHFEQFVAEVKNRG